MEHPRRNEVFREVGGAERDKDAEGFVDVSEVSVENDCALLFCTDGLTDLVPSVNIAQPRQPPRGAARRSGRTPWWRPRTRPAARTTSRSCTWRRPGSRPQCGERPRCPCSMPRFRRTQPGSAQAGAELYREAADAGILGTRVGLSREWTLARRTTWLALGRRDRHRRRRSRPLRASCTLARTPSAPWSWVAIRRSAASRRPWPRLAAVMSFSFSRAATWSRSCCPAASSCARRSRARRS